MREPLAFGKDFEAEKENYLITRFGALSFFLSAVEFVIPKPLPFLRLGISNVPLIIAAGFFSPQAYSLLAFIKIAAQGVLGGTFFSWIFLFSAAGTAASSALMFALKRALKDKVSAIGLSVAGAFASNLAQIAVARAWIFGESARAIAPLLLAAGVVTGLASGVFAELFSQKSLWLSQIKARFEKGDLPQKKAKSERGSEGAAKSARRLKAIACLRVAAGFFCIVATALLSSPSARAIILIAFYVALCAAKRRPRLLPAFFSILAIAAFNLYPPRGEILAEIAGFRIAADSLKAGLSRAFFFEAIIFISRWTFMPGKFQLPQGKESGKKGGRASRLLSRVFKLLAETLSLFGKLNSAPKEKEKGRAKKKKLSLEGATSYIDSLLQRIEA